MDLIATTCQLNSTKTQSSSLRNPSLRGAFPFPQQRQGVVMRNVAENTLHTYYPALKETLTSELDVEEENHEQNHGFRDWT